ncbi:MAG: hydantoinase/oxoprolinase family protein [Hyphomicrobiales bacterium]
MTSYRLGIDIGGTFTDFSLTDEQSGETTIAKVPSTPSHPSRSVIEGIGQLCRRRNISPQAIGYFAHGTTIGVNTLLERKGARLGMLVTRGFRDLLTIGRSRLPDIFDLSIERPTPLVPRHLVRTIDERMMADGRVRRALPEEEILAAVESLASEGIEALTITFLHSYRNDAHERRAREIVRARFPDLYVSLSSETWPQIREYERALISAVNAYVGRKMDRYFASLEEEVGATGISARLLSTKSNGGIMTADSARAVPVETLSSGPASGVIGASYVGSLAGFTKLLPLDMGGTSTEVAVVDGRIRFANENKVGGLEIGLPSVDVSSIGAGGSSIAWIDAAGILKVGPQSVGSEPGPVCYGRGGTQATITDAYVTLGILDPKNFLGGELRLDPELSHKAIDALSARLGLGRVQTAEAILRVATSNMFSELVPLMARKGVDVSEFALLCYGGAGPTHGFMLAKEVGILLVLIPKSPGTLCALGALVADAKSDFIASLHKTLPLGQGDRETIALMRRSIAGLRERALGWLEAERIGVSEKLIEVSADIRYIGQAFEVTTDLTDIALDAPDAAAAVRERFDTVYRAIYGQADRKALEIINVRATVIGKTYKPPLERIGAAATEGPALPARKRPVFLEGEVLEVGVYERKALLWGQTFDGPAIVEQYDTTVFIPPGFACRVDQYGTIIGEAT